MSDRFFNARWDPDLSIVLKVIDNGLCPFDLNLVANQCRHQADLLEFLTRRTCRYGGIVKQEVEEAGTVYVKYVPEVKDNYWAWANINFTDDSPAKIVGGTLEFDKNRVNAPDRFAGIFPHEFGHNLGFQHWNQQPSIMNNQPYRRHVHQGMWMPFDLKSLGQLFYAGLVPMWPTAFDYGDLSQQKCMILIPQIQWRPGEYAMVYLDGLQYDGVWELRTTAEQIIPLPYYVGQPKAKIENDVLTIPLRYMEQSIVITAVLREYNRPSSKVRFEVTGIAPDASAAR